MVVKTEEPAKSRVADLISARMAERGVSIKDLSEKIDIVYEHTRRVVRGESAPSRFVLKVICEYLKLPYKELLEAYNTDKMRHQFGDLPLLLAGKKPSLEPLERIWDDLTDEQHRDIISMAQAWAKRARLDKMK